MATRSVKINWSIDKIYLDRKSTTIFRLVCFCRDKDEDKLAAEKEAAAKEAAEEKLAEEAEETERKHQSWLEIAKAVDDIIRGKEARIEREERAAEEKEAKRKSWRSTYD